MHLVEITQEAYRETRGLQGETRTLQRHKRPTGKHKRPTGRHKRPTERHKSPTERHKRPRERHESPTERHKSPTEIQVPYLAGITASLRVARTELVRQDFHVVLGVAGVHVVQLLTGRGGDDGHPHLLENPHPREDH